MMTRQLAASALGALALLEAGQAAAVETAYVGVVNPGSVLAVDTRTNTITARIPVGLQNGNEAVAASVSRDGTRAYATSQANRTLSVIDTAANAVIAIAPLASVPVDVIASPDGRRVYVSTADGKVLFFDTAIGGVIGALNLSSSSLGRLAITPDSGKLYVQNGVSALTVISTVAGAVVTTLAVDSNGAGMSVSPDGRKLYVGNLQASRATVVDTATNAISFLNTPVFPTRVGFSPDGSKLLIGLANPVIQNGLTVYDGNVLIMNAATGESIQTIHVGLLPTNVGTTADGARLYVTNLMSGNMSVFDLVAQQFIATTVLGPEIATEGPFIANAPPPKLLASVLPQARSVGMTNISPPATAFATIINPGATTATNCKPSLGVDPFNPLTLNYQTTNAQNVIVGQPDTSVSIPAGGRQGFVVSLKGATNFGFRTQADLTFVCDNLRAPVYPAVDEFFVNVEASPTPDIIPAAATPSNDGVIRIATRNGAQVMAAAAVNQGATGSITVKPLAVGGGAPVNLSVYETDVNGQPLGQPGASVTSNFVQNAPRYFGVIATATGAIPLQADAVRVVLEFRDSIGTLRGQTSVALTAP